MHQLELWEGDASPITGVLPFLTFLLLTLSKGLFTSRQMSRIVGTILRFFEIGFFPKMEKYWDVPPIIKAQNVWAHLSQILGREGV